MVRSVGQDRNPFNPDSGVVTFGVGRNMVLSMRHWAMACGVVEPAPAASIGAAVPTAFGSLVLGDDGDPFLERSASVWLLHWRIARAPGRSTAWYFAFNEFEETVFTRETLVDRLWTLLNTLRVAGKLNDSRITRVTLARDVDCLIRSYVPKAGRAIEDGMESPFAELPLLGVVPIGSALQFRRGPKPTLPDEVFAAALLEFWRDCHQGRGTMSVGAATYEPGSPGRVFLMDEEAVAERLERIGALTGGAILWDEGAGLRQASRRSREWSDPLDLVRPLYPPARSGLPA